LPHPRFAHTSYRVTEAAATTKAMQDIEGRIRAELWIDPQLVGFVRDAAREGNVVLLSFDQGLRVSTAKSN
jgi:hypothetical protein